MVDTQVGGNRAVMAASCGETPCLPSDPLQLFVLHAARGAGTRCRCSTNRHAGKPENTFPVENAPHQARRDSDVS